MKAIAARRHHRLAPVVLLAPGPARHRGASTPRSRRAPASAAAGHPDRRRRPARRSSGRTARRATARAPRAATAVPSLIGVGAAAVDFQVEHRPDADAGERPAGDRQAAAVRRRADRPARGLRRLARRPARPSRRPSRSTRPWATPPTAWRCSAPTARCATARSASGGALSEGKFAPSLDEQHAHPDLRGDAHRAANRCRCSTTPTSPPRRSGTSSPSSTSRRPAPPVARDLGGVGPVAEGLWVWVVGMGLLIGVRGVDRSEVVMSTRPTSDLDGARRRDGAAARAVPEPRAAAAPAADGRHRPRRRPARRAAASSRSSGSRSLGTVGFVVAYFAVPSDCVGRRASGRRPCCSASRLFLAHVRHRRAARSTGRRR